MLGPLRTLGSAIKLSATPADPSRRAPLLGEHTHAILTEFGFSEDEIAALRQSGAISYRIQKSNTVFWRRLRRADPAVFRILTPLFRILTIVRQLQHLRQVQRPPAGRLFDLLPTTEPVRHDQRLG